MYTKANCGNVKYLIIMRLDLSVFEWPNSTEFVSSGVQVDSSQPLLEAWEFLLGKEQANGCLLSLKPPFFLSIWSHQASSLGEDESALKHLLPG